MISVLDFLITYSLIPCLVSGIVSIIYNLAIINRDPSAKGDIIKVLEGTKNFKGSKLSFIITFYLLVQLFFNILIIGPLIRRELKSSLRKLADPIILVNGNSIKNGTLLYDLKQMKRTGPTKGYEHKSISIVLIENTDTIVLDLKRHRQDSTNYGVHYEKYRNSSRSGNKVANIRTTQLIKYQATPTLDQELHLSPETK